MKILTEDKAEKFLIKYAPTAKSVMTTSVIAAVAASGGVKFPLVLKLISPQAIHKTEVRGVRIVHTVDQLRSEYGDIMKSAIKKKMKVSGILVQEMLKGEEVIIGIKKDPTFGHVIAFGIGGKHVEIIRDIAFRVCPIDDNDAQSMINELKYKKILQGARGAKPVNMRLLKKTLVGISRIPTKHPGIEELDINPFIINDRTGKIADARILMN